MPHTSAPKLVRENPTAVPPVTESSLLTREPASTFLPMTIAPACTKMILTTELPVDPREQVTVAADVTARAVPLEAKLSCLRNCTSGSELSYQFAFLPIGCFGTPLLLGKCEDVSCRLAERLNEVVHCGRQKFGSFLGDNFYPWGLSRKDLGRFEVELRAKFWKHKNLRFKYYSTVGNHDKPKPNYQLRTDHAFWVMPAFHHASPILTGDDGVTTVQLFLFDTHWGFQANDAHMEAEAQWLDAALSNSTARWKIVGTHEPIWGFMGFEHGKGMVDFIHPVLVKHRIRLFVCAHAHSASVHRAPGGYFQLVSAGFSANVHDLVKPQRPAGYYHLGTGATMVLIDADRIDIAAFDDRLNWIWDATVPFEGVEYGDPNWRPKDSVFGGTKFDYWQWRPQCDAVAPLVPPQCVKK